MFNVLQLENCPFNMNISKLDYIKNRGTSCCRKETTKDHAILSEMMKCQWPILKSFYRTDYDEIRKWQFNKIQELVNFAFENVPLYRKKYKKVGFKPGDLKNWSDFESLPILYKDELIESFPKESVSRLHNLEFTTRSSGSSGKFVTIAVSPEAIYLDTIQGLRQMEFQSGNNYFGNDVVLFIYTCPWWVSSINDKYKLKFIDTSEKMDTVFKKIFEIKPNILSTYPSFLKKMIICGFDFKKTNIKLVIVHSEQSSRTERDYFREQINIPVLDEFSSEELTRIALECPNRNYHLEEDASYNEVVDFKTKKNVENGKRGFLVGTNLMNKATPIIRYFQGDILKIIGSKKCDCGSNFRMIEPILGRHMDSILLENGDFVPASCIMDLAYNWFLKLKIPVHGLQYQIVQYEDGNITVYLIKGKYELSDNDISLIREDLKRLLSKNISVSVCLVDSLPFTSGVKFRPVISLRHKLF